MTEALRSSRGAAPGSSYRGDIGGSTIFSTPNRRRRLFVDASGAPLPARQEDDPFGPSSSAADATSEADADGGRVIWGTNISIEKTRSNFRRFLMEFKRRDRMRFNGDFVGPEDGQELEYVEMMKQMQDLGLYNLNLDVKNLAAFDRTKSLYVQLHNYPLEIIPIMDQTIRDCMVSMVAENGGSEDEIAETSNTIYKVRPFNLAKSHNMRDLNPGGKLFLSLILSKDY